MPMHLRTDEGLPIIKKKEKEMILSIEPQGLENVKQVPYH